jgi:hypothetical protein
MGTFVYTLPIGKCKTFYGRNLRVRQIRLGPFHKGSALG